jgi:hypothetical protein
VYTRVRKVGFKLNLGPRLHEDDALHETALSNEHSYMCCTKPPSFLPVTKTDSSPQQNHEESDVTQQKGSTRF